MSIAAWENEKEKQEAAPRQDFYMKEWEIVLEPTHYSSATERALHLRPRGIGPA